MPHISYSEISETLKQIEEGLSPYLNVEFMRDLDCNIASSFRALESEVRGHAHVAIAKHISRLIDEGKLSAEEDKE